MSIELMSLVWKVDFLTQSQKLIMLRMADFSNDDGASIYPSRSRIADECGCSLSTVKATLKALMDCGLVSIERKGGKGVGDTNQYNIDTDILRALASGQAALAGDSCTLELCGYAGDKKGSVSDPLVSTRGQSGVIRGQPAADKGSASRPQLTNNHQIDSSRAPASASNVESSLAGASEPPRNPDTGQYHLSASEHPDLFAAWLAYHRANSQGHRVRSFERLGFMVVDTLRPPIPPAEAAKLTADRIIGEAAE